MILKHSPVNSQKRVPIQRRVMRIVLITTLAALLVTGVTGMFCIAWVRDVTENVLTAQLETNLKSLVQQKAVAAEARLEHYQKYIEFVTDYLEEMYVRQDEMIASGHIFYPPRDTDEYALTRGFTSEDLSAQDFREELLFYSNLEPIWDPVARENENLITTVYAGTKDGLLVSYDRWSYLSVPENGHEMIYNYFDSSWYSRGLREDGPFFTGLYVDSQGRGLTITVASPFRDAEGKFAGVNCADFDITGLYEELLALDLGGDPFSFTLDQEGAVISPDAENRSAEEYTGLSSELLAALRSEPDGILETEDAIYISVPIERVNWTLCTRFSMESVRAGLRSADIQIRNAAVLFLFVALAIVVVAILAVRRVAAAITRPVEMLGRDIKIISDGDLNYRAAVLSNDEIGDVTRNINEMVDRLNFTMNELLDTRRHADAMSRLATWDSLTGTRNKTAYDEQVCQLETELDTGETDFGFAMIDLNNLKVINDTYGHHRGDEAIKKLCKLICDTFSHSPVFRVGGDEFVVVLKNDDYRNIASLADAFNQSISVMSGDTGVEPWNRISAALGYALYDPRLDAGVKYVLIRADREMYRKKRRMKRE